MFFIFKQVEVFNILFIREQEKRHVVHCMGCARKQAPSLQGFVCLEEYRLVELTQVYDAFLLHKSQGASSSQFSTTPSPSPTTDITAASSISTISIV